MRFLMSAYVVKHGRVKWISVPWRLRESIEEKVQALDTHCRESLVWVCIGRLNSLSWRAGDCWRAEQSAHQCPQGMAIWSPSKKGQHVLLFYIFILSKLPAHCWCQIHLEWIGPLFADLYQSSRHKPIIYSSSRDSYSNLVDMSHASLQQCHYTVTTLPIKPILQVKGPDTVVYTASEIYSGQSVPEFADFSSWQ